MSMASTRIGIVALIAAATGCGGVVPPAEPGFDFSGAVPFDLAHVNVDASFRGPDLAGYDLTCDAAGILAGGDPRGHWNYYAACASPDSLYQLQANCPTIAIDGFKMSGPDGSARPYGTLDLNSDKTYSRDTHSLLTAHATVPSTCSQPFGSCESYGVGESAQVNWLDMRCHQGSDCSCTIRVDMSVSETGTWTATSTGFTTSSTLGGPQPFDSSSSGDVLRHRGDATTLRRNRGLTYVLLR